MGRIDSSRVARVAGRVATDARWRSFYLQRYCRSATLRGLVRRALARSRPPVLACADGPEARRIAAEVDSLGISVLPGAIPTEAAARLREWLMARPCFIRDRPGSPGIYWPKNVPSYCVNAYYTSEDLIEAPGFLELCNDPRVLGAVSRLFSCAPTIAQIDCWWLNHAYDLSSARVAHEYFLGRPKEYHRDIEDWGMLRYFVYLTDVDEGGAPHTFIPGTHNEYLGHKRGIDLAVEHGELYDRRLDTVGPAGTGILIDPYGLHRASVPRSADRLMLAVTYTLASSPVFAPGRPLTTARGRDIDPWVNRFFVAPESSGALSRPG